MKIKFITSNPSKVEMATGRLAKYDIELTQLNLELSENRSMEVEEVAKFKADQAMKRANEPFLIEDSAFYIKSLGGFPGTFVKLAFDVLGEEKICKLVRDEVDKSALVKSILIYGNPKTGEMKVFTGLFEGSVSDYPKGENSRGWKIVRVFIPKNGTKTLAELNDAEWNQFLADFIKNDHYEQFGQWIITKEK